MLPAVESPAVLELEDDAAVHVQLLAVPLAVLWWMPITRPSSSVRTRCSVGLEGAARLAAVPAELGEDRVATLGVAREGASPGVCHEALSSKISVSASMSAALKAS